MTFHEQINGPPRYTFKTRIRKVLKGNVMLLNITDDQYVIVGSKANLNFAVGRTYYIFGVNANGIIYTGTCYRNMPLEYTTRRYRYSLETFYKLECDCSEEDPPYQLCQLLSSLMERRNEYCDWVKPKYLRSCHNGMLDSFLLR